MPVGEPAHLTLRSIDLSGRTTSPEYRPSDHEAGEVELPDAEVGQVPPPPLGGEDLAEVIVSITLP